MKVCGKCGFPKNEREFHKNKHNSDGLHSWCKMCRKGETSRYLEDNKEQISARKAEDYRDKKDVYSERNKTYYRANRQIVISKTTEYRQTHKTERNLQEKNRYSEDGSYRLRKLVSSTILKALKKNSSSKNGGSILDFLPYSVEGLKEHLEKQFESWMTWNNQGNYNPQTWNDNDPVTWTWQLDHIIPRASLPYTSMQDENFRKCWALNNLRPYSSKLNIIDGSTRIRHGGNNE